MKAKNILFLLLAVLVAAIIILGFTKKELFIKYSDKVKGFLKTTASSTKNELGKLENKLDDKALTKDLGSVSNKNDVLISVGGTPALYLEEYENLVNSNPQLVLQLSMNPDIEKEIIAALADVKVMNKWVKENKIDQSEEFKKLCADYEKSIKEQLAIKFFEDKFPINFNENDLKEHYSTVNDGKECLLVRFDSKTNAEEFFKAVEGVSLKEYFERKKDKKTALELKSLSNFEDLAKAQKLDVKKEVMKKTVLDSYSDKVKEFINSAKNYPKIGIVNNLKSYWFIYVEKFVKADFSKANRQELKSLESGLRQNKLKAAFLDLKQKSDYKVDINQALFDSKLDKKSAQNKKLMEQFMNIADLEEAVLKDDKNELAQAKAI